MVRPGLGRMSRWWPPYGAEICAETVELITVLPNVDLVCDTHLLVPGDSVTGATSSDGCGLSGRLDTAVYSFDAAAGARYTATLVGHERPTARLVIISRDGDRIVEFTTPSATFTAPETGRYHILVFEAGAFTLSLRSN